MTARGPRPATRSTRCSSPPPTLPSGGPGRCRTRGRSWRCTPVSGRHTGATGGRQEATTITGSSVVRAPANCLDCRRTWVRFLGGLGNNFCTFQATELLCRTGREVGPGHGVVQQSQKSVPREIREADWQQSSDRLTDSQQSADRLADWQQSSDRLTDSQQREAACRSLTLPRRLGARGSRDGDQEADRHFFSLPRPKTSKV